MNRKIIAALLVVIGAGLLTYAAATVEPVAGLVVAGVFLILAGMFGVDV